MSQANKTIDRAACPLLDQRGEDAVQNWRQVLASIDPATLPAELRAELQALRAVADAPDERAVGADDNTPPGWRKLWRIIARLRIQAMLDTRTAKPGARLLWLVSEGVRRYGGAEGSSTPRHDSKVAGRQAKSCLSACEA